MITLVQVEPIGRRRSMAFVDGPGHHAFEEVEVPVYPLCQEAQRLMDMRRSLGLSFREVARKIGVSAVEYCDLERGRRKPLHEDGWMEIENILRGQP